jgi:hypothetical protein
VLNTVFCSGKSGEALLSFIKVGTAQTVYSLYTDIFLLFIGDGASRDGLFYVGILGAFADSIG